MIYWIHHGHVEWSVLDSPSSHKINRDYCALGGRALHLHEVLSAAGVASLQWLETHVAGECYARPAILITLLVMMVMMVMGPGTRAYSMYTETYEHEGRRVRLVAAVN